MSVLQQIIPINNIGPRALSFSNPGETLNEKLTEDQESAAAVRVATVLPAGTAHLQPSILCTLIHQPLPLTNEHTSNFCRRVAPLWWLASVLNTRRFHSLILWLLLCVTLLFNLGHTICDFLCYVSLGIQSPNAVAPEDLFYWLSEWKGF